VTIVRSERGIENWHLKPFEVTSKSKVQTVELKKDWAEPGETLTGRVLLDGPIQQNHIVQIRLVDEDGRTLTRKNTKAADAPFVSFEFPIHAWMPMLLRVEGALLENNEEISSAYTFARVTNRHQDQFNFVVWNWPSGDLSPYGSQSFAKHGVTAILQGGAPSFSLAASNLSYVPYTTSFRMSSHTVTAMLDDHGIMKNGCIHDPAVMEKWISSVVERQREARGHGVLVYSLGDENAVHGSCLSDHCLGAYRRYLQRIHGTIAALNEQWESDFSSFDAITLLEGEKLPAENAPRWFQEFFAQRLQKNRTDNEGGGEARPLRSGCASVLDNRAAWQFQGILSNPGTTPENRMFDCALPRVAQYGQAK